MSNQPYSPIPASQIVANGRRFSQIRPVVLTFRGGDVLRAESSHAVLGRLADAAEAGEVVTGFACGGLDADADSVAALNCYLRTARAMGRMHLPYDRLNRAHGHRFKFAGFCAYLGLIFR